MCWLEKWKLLSARMSGVHAAGTHITQVMQINSSNCKSTHKFPDTLQKIKSELERFKKEYEQELPESAREVLGSFLNQWSPSAPLNGHEYIILHCLAVLISFQSEFEYLIADTDIEIRSRTERAFEHLKRSVAVDAFILRNNNKKNDTKNKTKWQTAYEEGEVVFEKLGAVHLLQHGIWAFKVDGIIGGRTDLVYNEPIDEKSLRRSASNLVLTEWKRVTEIQEQDIEKFIKPVIAQIEKYVSGVLGGIELKNTRYIILVSKKKLELPHEPNPINGIQYRYINIPVDPALPSKA